MKKYFNKGLMFEWFNSSKAAIILGAIIFGFFLHDDLENRFYEVRCQFSDCFRDAYYSNLDDFYVLAFIFVMIHFASQGINKRNKEMFLTCSPYTKKQIRYNEVICLFITMNIFVLLYLYMAGMTYYRHSELISMLYGYGTSMLIDVLRIYLFGICGILVMLIITSMFSNSVIGIIAMMTAIPGSIVMIAHNTVFIVQNIILDRKYINDNYNYNDKPRTINIFWDDSRLFVEDLTTGKVLSGIAIFIVIIAILCVMYTLMQKLNKFEYSTKLFTSRISEKFNLALYSLGFTCFLLMIYIEQSDYGYVVKNAHPRVTFMIPYMIIFVVGIFASHKILNKIVKTVN